jgi:isoquinoline 1-oxidoreductase beta subunit
MKTTAHSNIKSLSRRKFIVDSALVTGGLAISVKLPFGGSAHAAAATGGAAAQGAEINHWVVIKPDDSVVIRVARAEMGQGTHTGLAQLLAEELECNWSKVSVEPITAGQNYGRKRAWGDMSTGGSRGIRTSQDYIRQSGAAARGMLLQAAADEWKVPVGEVTVENGVISHKASNRTTTYGKVAAAATKLPPPDLKSVKLKDPKQWKIAGKPVKRVDTAPKLDGSQIYAIDIKLPGMLNAAIMQCPVFGGKLVSFDEAKIAKMPGVVKALKVDDGTVAVVADTWWHASTALKALPIKWDEGENAKANTASILAHLKEGLTNADEKYADINEGDAIKAYAAAPKKVEATYSVPFVAHACMEPMNAVVRLAADKAEVWVATQNAEASLAALSTASGLPLAQCEAYPQTLGGGFGRRGGTQDYVRQATLIAKQLPPGTPVKMIWSREEDMTHDFYRPITQCLLQGGLDEKGNLQSLRIRVSGQSINAYLNPSAIKGGGDKRQLQGYYKEPGDAQLGYSVPNLRTEYAMRNTHVPVGPWRGVNTNQNSIFLECFMDELAKAANKDPVEFRRALMKEHPKHLGVLNATAEAAGWGKPLPNGVYRGVAQHMGYGSYTAAVAEVSMVGGKVKVHRLVMGTNCGHAVSIDQIKAQVEGSVAYGLGAAYYQELNVDKGRIVEDNFHTYRMMTMADFPKVETVIAPTYDFWGGVGEPTICVAAPAVMNAIFAATGKPVRSLPMKNLKLV